MFDHEFREWLSDAIVTLSHQLNHVQRSLDTLLASSGVPTEQLNELNEETQKLKSKTALLAQSLEANKPKEEKTE